MDALTEREQMIATAAYQKGMADGVEATATLMTRALESKEGAQDVLNELSKVGANVSKVSDNQ